MTKLSELSVMRKDAESNASRLFVEYSIKYVEKIQDKSDGSKTYLQKMLRSVGEWKSSKVDKEYLKFIKWCVKRGTTEDIIKENLQIFVLLSLRIVLNKRIHEDMVRDYQINTKQFFYKCLRRVSRQLYDNIRSLNNAELYIGKRDANELVVSCLHELIPLEKLIEVMELFDGEEDSNHTYNFERTFSDSDDSKGKILIEKEGSDTHTKSDRSSEPELQYVPSEKFHEEYYNSEDEQHNDGENVKEIKIPKYNTKGFYNRKQKKPLQKPKIDERGEAFFSE
jgi:hypothetical protein